MVVLGRKFPQLSWEDFFLSSGERPKSCLILEFVSSATLVGSLRVGFHVDGEYVGVRSILPFGGDRLPAFEFRERN